MRIQDTLGTHRFQRAAWVRITSRWREYTAVGIPGTLAAMLTDVESDPLPSGTLEAMRTQILEAMRTQVSISDGISESPRSPHPGCPGDRDS